MPGITIKVDAAKCLAALSVLASKQIPFAAATALNDLAFQVQRAEQAGILETFKHPRPFTVKSTTVDKATKSNLTATVSIRPEVAKYLQPYETGGEHVLPGKGLTLLNPKDIRLDQYGQLTKNKLNQLAARKDVFIGTVKGITGFWQRVPVPVSKRRRVMMKGVITSAVDPTAPRTRLKLLIRFGDALAVKKHLGFEDRGEATVKAGFEEAFEKAMDRALASAR